MRRFSILIVEDDDDEAFFIERAARSVDELDLIRKESGRAALEHLRSAITQRVALPDAIVTDLKMPEMDGFEFLLHLAKIPEIATTPRFVLSSSDHSGDKKRAQELGTVRFFTKPGQAAAFSSVFKAITGDLKFASSNSGLVKSPEAADSGSTRW